MSKRKAAAQQAESVDDQVVDLLQQLHQQMRQGMNRDTLHRTLLQLIQLNGVDEIRKRGFSSMRATDAQRVFGLDEVLCSKHPEDANQLTTQQLQQIVNELAEEQKINSYERTVDDETMDQIVNQINMCCVAFGGYIGVGSNESTRVHLMHSMLVPIVCALKLRNKCKPGCEARLKLASEYQVASDQSQYHGPVEFVLNYKQLYLFITEVKSDNLIQGATQNIFQLYSAYTANTIKFPVFGLTTNASLFEFTMYDGNTFKRTVFDLINIRPKLGAKGVIVNKQEFKQSLAPVVNLLYSILQLELFCASPPSSPEPAAVQSTSRVLDSD